MNSFAPDDAKHLTSAEGWLALGDWQSANEELEAINPALRAHPEVLLLRVAIYLKAGRADMARAVAHTLARACALDWRTHYALAQAEAQIGNVSAAQAALERAFALADVRLKALDDEWLAGVWRMTKGQ